MLGYVAWIESEDAPFIVNHQSNSHLESGLEAYFFSDKKTGVQAMKSIVHNNNGYEVSFKQMDFYEFARGIKQMNQFNNVDCTIGVFIGSVISNHLTPMESIEFVKKLTMPSGSVDDLTKE
jgi:hypothetical protein